MADNQDADIDEIIGQEDLELDELDESPQKEEQKVDDLPEDKEQKGTDGDEEGEKPQGEAEKQPEPEESPASDEKEPEEPPAPLTKQDIQEAIREFRDSERDSTKQVDEFTEEVIKKYYPNGLSNVLVDEKTGKELKTPQDVVDASGDSMTIEEATQWLMNEQYKLDKQIAEIKDNARELAEVNANFDSGLNRVLEKYKDVFEKFPQQQQKLYKAYMKQVKMDKDLVLSAPDIEEFYDLFMEPYVLAFGNMQAQEQPAKPSAPPADSKPPAQIPNAKPSIEDRLDETGDGGSASDDPNPNDPDESLSKLFGE